MDAAIKRTDEKFKRIVQDAEVRQMHNLIEKAELDWYNSITSAEEKGLKAGMEKGMEKVARNALAKGLSIDLIRAITGLDEDKIKKLQ